MRKKLLTNITLIETVEYIENDDTTITLKQTMSSGNIINSNYTHSSKALEDYKKIKKSLGKTIENTEPEK